jgi:hypothetical protein
MKLRNTTPNSEQIWACCCIDDLVVKASYDDLHLNTKIKKLKIKCMKL